MSTLEPIKRRIKSPLKDQVKETERRRRGEESKRRGRREGEGREKINYKETIKDQNVEIS